MSEKSNFKKGFAELFLLHILKEKGDCYGYEICQLIKEISGGILIYPEGSMYPALYRLIDLQCISDYKKLVGKRMTRVYYHLEAKGEERLARLMHDYLETYGAIQKILTFDYSSIQSDETT